MSPWDSKTRCPARLYTCITHLNQYLLLCVYVMRTSSCWHTTLLGRMENTGWDHPKLAASRHKVLHSDRKGRVLLHLHTRPRPCWPSAAAI